MEKGNEETAPPDKSEEIAAFIFPSLSSTNEPFALKPWNNVAIKLNIGGHYYQTTRDTLLKGQRNFFTALLSGQMRAIQDDVGAYFIDRDGEYFQPILGFMRTGELYIPPHLVPEKVYLEAQYFNIKLPPPVKFRSETKIILVQYHAFDNIGTFKNKLQVEITKFEKIGWRFVASKAISGGLMQLGVNKDSGDEPTTWFLYFQRKVAVTKDGSLSPSEHE